MEGRKDAVVAAADVVAAVRRIGLRRPGVGRATVGRLSVPDSAPNVVPGLARLTVELRHPEPGQLQEMSTEVRAALAGVEAGHGVGVSVALTLAADPVSFDPAVVEAVEASAQACGLASRRMISGAGHDAVPLAGVLPVGMIFVPCGGGVSHAPQERLDAQAAADGAAVLLEAVRRLAG